MNTKNITFNEFTTKLVKNGFKITEMKTQVLADKVQLILHIAEKNTPVIFNWNQFAKRWLLSQG